MRTGLFILFAGMFFCFTTPVNAQEWRNMRLYRHQTGDSVLRQGCWLEKNRKRHDRVWADANRYNLASTDGNLKYRTISQIRDFYLWFDSERKERGDEITWIGIASVAAKQLSMLDYALIRFLVVRDKEVVTFANEGSQKVFGFAFPRMREVYFSGEIITGESASQWTQEYGTQEQCIILDPLYRQLSVKSLRKLERMARGEGIFRLGISKELRYEGSLEDCHTRFRHGIDKILPNYLKNSVHSR